MADYEEKSYWLASSPYEESPPLDGRVGGAQGAGVVEGANA